MRKFAYNKLVRDEIVKLQEDDGYIVHSAKLTGESLVQFVVAKMHEETDEIHDAVNRKDRDDVVAELADLVELVITLSDLYKIDSSELLDARLRKNSKSGDFSTGTFISHVEVPDDNAWIDYYENNSDKYPEIS